MKLYFRVKGSLATDSTHREEDCVEQCRAQSRSKWHGENMPLDKSLYWASASQVEILGAHEFWSSDLEVHGISPPYTTTAEAGEYTHRERTGICVVRLSTSKTCEGQVLSKRDEQKNQKVTLGSDPKPRAITSSIGQTICSTQSYSAYEHL